MRVAIEAVESARKREGPMTALATKMVCDVIRSGAGGGEGRSRDPWNEETNRHPAKADRHPADGTRDGKEVRSQQVAEIQLPGSDQAAMEHRR